MTDSTNLLNPVTPLQGGAVISASNPLPVSVSNVTASLDATATAAAPSYSEGTANPLSQNLTGDLRVIAKLAATQTLATVTTVSAVTAITNALPAGANSIGTVQIGNTPNTTPILVQSSFSFSNITTATTTVVKSGAGVIHGVTINTKGTVASAVTIYDNTAGSGTKIAVIDSLNLSGAFFYDAGFATGLTVVTTGTVAPDITVMYR